MANNKPFEDPNDELRSMFHSILGSKVHPDLPSLIPELQSTRMYGGLFNSDTEGNPDDPNNKRKKLALSDAAKVDSKFRLRLRDKGKLAERNMIAMQVYGNRCKFCHGTPADFQDKITKQGRIPLTIYVPWELGYDESSKHTILPKLQKLGYPKKIAGRPIIIVCDYCRQAIPTIQQYCNWVVWNRKKPILTYDERRSLRRAIRAGLDINDLKPLFGLSEDDPISAEMRAYL